MRAYLDININFKRLSFFWLRMLKSKGVVGPENGFLSEEAYLIIMITWLQKNFHITKAQIGIENPTKEVKQEKVADNHKINLGFVYSLRGQLGAKEMEHLEKTGEVLQKEHDRNPYLMVDYTFEKDPAKLRVKADKMVKLTSGKRLKNKSTSLAVILVLLVKKLILSLPRKNMVFDTKKGRLYSKRSNRLLVSVKDPFIKELNYGYEMREKEKLKQLIAVLKSFLKAAAGGEGTIDEFILDRGDPSLSVSASSMNQTSSLTNSASPPEGVEEEEKKAPVEATRLNIS